MSQGNGVRPLHRNRDFAILWSGQAVSELGDSMSSLVFPLLGYAITHSTVQAGLATMALSVGSVVSRLPAGALVDRWPRGRVLVLANVVSAIAYASLAVAALTGRATLVHLVLVGFVSGVADSFIAPAASAATRTVVPASQLPLAYTRLQLRGHTAELVGPPLGGALFSVLRGLPFLVDAVSYGVYSLAALSIRTPLPAPDGPRRSVVKDLGEGLGFVWRHSVIRSVMLWGGLFNFAAGYAFMTITLRLVQAGVHPAAIGAIETISAVAGIVGALVAPALMSRTRTSVMTFVTGLALAAALLPTAWTTNVFVIGPLLAVGVFWLPANNSGISAYMVSQTPDRLQARVNSAGGFISTAIQPLSPLLAGALVGSLGGTSATVVGAGLVAVSLTPLLTSREVRTLGRPAEWALDAASAAPPAAE